MYFITHNGDIGETAPMARVHDWVTQRPPGEFDKPTKQELILLFAWILLIPLLMAFAIVWLFIRPDIKDLSRWKRILYVLSMPVLLPAGCCYVVFVDFFLPVFNRLRTRARALREADRAVKELIRSAV